MLQECFAADIYRATMSRRYGLSEHINQKITKYLEIPLTGEYMEVPVFAYQSFLNVSSDPDKIVAVLEYAGRIMDYKTLEPNMKYALFSDFEHCRLVKVNVSFHNETFPYYVTYGAVFDKDFNPVMMCSWLLHRLKENLTEESSFEVVRPILRIDPQCFIENTNPIQKFIISKVTPAILTEKMYYSPLRGETRRRRRVSMPEGMTEVSVEVSTIPFHILSAKAPSISTTNESLIKLAEDYADELFQ